MKTRNDFLDAPKEKQWEAMREYYSQFVTQAIKDRVKMHFSLERLLASTNKHLNDIPLRQWDFLAETTIRNNTGVLEKAKEAGEGGFSLCFGVSLLKEAAREIIEENS